MKGERHSRGRASLLLLWPLETHHQMVGWCCDSKEYIGFPQRDTFTTNTRLSIVKLKWKVLFLNEISTMWEMAHLLWQNDCWHESNFHFLYWFFQNWQIAWCFEINSKMSEFLQFEKHSRAVSSPCNVWNKIMQGCLKKKQFSIFLLGRKLPGDVLPQKYQPIWQPFLKCCTKLCQIQEENASENPAPHPFEWWK